MPESPEVQALAEELGARLSGRALSAVDVIEFRILKSRARQPSSLIGARVSAVARHGKLVDLVFESSEHLVVSLGRHGWARWAGAEVAEAEPSTEPSTAPGEAPVALASLEFDDGSVLELTDAGSWVSLGCWVVDDASDVPAVAKLGPDPADPAFDRAQFDAAFVGRRKQLKAVLQDQESLAGIGNAYSDEILFAAKLSPVVHASALSSDELDRLFQATVGVITGAIQAQRGVLIARLKQAKVDAMQVHGRAGEACPVCGDTIRDFSFASTTAQYCPTDQTHGELLPLRAAGS
ncbi:DNA-formamidopyrimidine glycosylase family protein [Rathayibacter sp. YIM 133350]|uniref:DNA-formamidopyrimidine glycosylase family protein n=1 Tax=Rathayibacter sp. YIM 133350 TaxID=3131992 RepID=UPI00307EE70D